MGGLCGGATRRLALAVGASFLMGCYLANLPIHTDNDEAPTINRNRVSTGSRLPIESRLLAESRALTDRPKLAILVPFRDRFENLLHFVPHMFSFLNKQGISFHIFVVQQRDEFRFNRASLINAGFLHVRGDYDYIAMHDVDLLPINDKLSYAYPEAGPFHVSGPELHPKYHYSTFIGGILLIKMGHYELVNGMSNRYWGWGQEDDEFYVRLKDAGLTVDRPQNITTGTENTFKHVHDRTQRRRDTRKCFNQREVTRRRDRQTGLHDLDYQLGKRWELTVEGWPFTVLDVELACNRTATPWCLCPDPAPKGNASKAANKKN